jgi:hypothetical protein
MGRFTGREAFEACIRLSLAHATREGWRTLYWMDADFADWPLGERGVETALQDWSKTGRRMVLLAKHHRVLAMHQCRSIGVSQRHHCP